jgi:predicted MPP superfamily phosphohydrolase
MPDVYLYSLAAFVAIGVPLYARLVRGRTYAIFGGVILLLSLTGALVSEARLVGWVAEAARPWITAIWIGGVLAAGLHLTHLVRARLRSRAFRLFVSVPGQVFIAAGFLAGPWQLLLWPLRVGVSAAGWSQLGSALDWLDLVPFALAVPSILTSKLHSPEWVRVRLAREGPSSVTRVPVERYRRRAPSSSAERKLRIVQITDPHLGPWQSVENLRRTLERLMRHDPDLVLLTGDFLTMEGQGSPGALAEALAPLRSVGERCYAIFGNHDHEAPDEVRSALAQTGIRLLVDEEAIADTSIGRVQILGADYVGRGRREHIQGLLERFPRRADEPRLLLLHDPLGFHDVPPGEADLTFSGHTHGGQVGLVSLGLDWTVLRRSRWPDHGLFAHGPNRLYVHRGTGFYGFPLRIGVPGEASVLELFPHPAR